jgi:hypothetical protein
MQLQGRVPEGFDMNMHVTMLGQHEPEIARTKHLRQAHAVVFFVPGAVTSDTDYLNRLKERLDRIKRVESTYRPLVVVGRMDELVPELREQPHKWESMPEVCECRSGIAKALEIDLARVLISVPYTSESERVHGIDVLAANNALTILRAASEYAFLRHMKSRT